MPAEPWTCGYLETSKECNYKINREKYCEERDSILFDNQTGVSASKLTLGKYSEWAAILMGQTKGDTYLVGCVYFGVIVELNEKEKSGLMISVSSMNNLSSNLLDHRNNHSLCGTG